LTNDYSVSEKAKSALQARVTSLEAVSALVHILSSQSLMMSPGESRRIFELLLALPQIPSNSIHSARPYDPKKQNIVRFKTNEVISFEE